MVNTTLNKRKLLDPLQLYCRWQCLQMSGLHSTLEITQDKGLKITPPENRMFFFSDDRFSEVLGFPLQVSIGTSYFFLYLMSQMYSESSAGAQTVSVLSKQEFTFCDSRSDSQSELCLFTFVSDRIGKAPINHTSRAVPCSLTLCMSGWQGHRWRSSQLSHHLPNPYASLRSCPLLKKW